MKYLAILLMLISVSCFIKGINSKTDCGTIVERFTSQTNSGRQELIGYKTPKGIFVKNVDYQTFMTYKTGDRICFKEHDDRYITLSAITFFISGCMLLKKFFDSI